MTALTRDAWHALARGALWTTLVLTVLVQIGMLGMVWYAAFDHERIVNLSQPSALLECGVEPATVNALMRDGFTRTDRRRLRAGCKAVH